MDHVKRLLGLGMFLVSASQAADYVCYAKVISFNDKVLKPAMTSVKLNASLSQDTQKVVFGPELEGKMTVLFAGGHEKRFALQLQGKSKLSSLRAFTSTSVFGEPDRVSSHSQYYNAQTDSYEEFLFNCVKRMK
jgi:hypothetical protein